MPRRLQEQLSRRCKQAARFGLAAGWGAGLVAGLVATLPAHAASMFEFDVWMRAIDQRSVTLQRHIAARRLADAGNDARELERLYALMQDYFAHDGRSQDAVQVSRDGRDLAARIPAALTNGDFDQAAQAALGIAQACNDCHDNYKPFNK